MLLSKPQDIASTVIMTPSILRDYLLPIRVGCVHGIVDHDNFDKVVNGAMTKYRNDIEEVIDIPSGGKLFVGKWLDFTGSQVNSSSYNCRYANNIYVDKISITAFNVAEMNDGIMYHRMKRYGTATIYNEYLFYVGTTLTVVGRATAVVGPCVIAPVAPYATLTGTVNVKYVPPLAINTATSVRPINCNNLIMYNAGTPNVGYASAVYARFSDMAHYANQMTHFIRSMEFQVSMSRESMQSMTQGLDYPGYSGGYDTWFGNKVANPTPIAPSKGATQQDIETYKRQVTLSYGKTINPRVSVTNKFRIEKPYDSDFICFNSTGASKMYFDDGDGNPSPNKMHYEAFVSSESDDELEITISSYFENSAIFGDSDYSFCTGKIEIVFEGRV